MAVYFYKKHPDHNLGGENYPHFRNQVDKLAYVKTIIDVTKPINFDISRNSFDAAVININQTELPAGQKLANLAGIASGTIPVTGNAQLEFWWIISWNTGANDQVISFNLQLDYWLTYWPLKFNNALVRIVKKHAQRFQKRVMPNETIDFFPWFTLTNRALLTHEADLSNNTTKFDQLTGNTFQPVLNYNTSTSLWRALVIVLNIPAGEITEVLGEHQNYYAFLGYKPRPRHQNGMVIFGFDGDPAITSWLSSPGITHCFYLYLDPSAINFTDYTIKYDRGSSAPKGKGNYLLNDKRMLIKKEQLNCVGMGRTEVRHTIEGYMSIIYLIVRYVYLSYQLNTDTRFKHECAILNVGDQNRVWWMSESEGTSYSYYLKDLTGAELPNLSLFFRGLKAGLQNDYWSGQIIRQYKNVYFTTLTAFNRYLKQNITTNNQKIELDMSFDKVFNNRTFKIDDPYASYQELKMYTHFKYMMNYSAHTQEFLPWTFTKDNEFYKSPTWTFEWYASLQNSYFIMTPQENLNLPSKIFNFNATNQSKVINYNDQMLKFYQQQGVSFQTSMDLALFNQAWTKKYNKLQIASLAGKSFGQIGAGVGGGGALGQYSFKLEPQFTQKQTDFISKVKRGVNAGSVFGAIGGAVNTGLNVSHLLLENKMRDKQAVYGVQSLLAQQTDLSNNPATTDGIGSLELNYYTTFHPGYKTDNHEQLPYVTVLAPTYNEFQAQALLYHKYGYWYDQEDKIDFNNEWTRYYFNFWQINNIEQAIIKNNLNTMVINWFNSLFNQGIRLWNVFNPKVIFNNYQYQNWEQVLLNKN